MNISKIVFCILAGLFFTRFVIAQPKIFVARWEHQTNQPEAFPNYFQNKSFTDSLTALTRAWLVKRFSNEVIDFKRQNPVSYAPVIMMAEPIKSIQNTGYDWALSLITTLEYHSSKDKRKPSGGVITCVTEFYDQNDRRFQRQKSKVEFIIVENKAFYAEAMISEEDFQKLYFAVIKALFEQEKTEKMVFHQPDDEASKAIIEKGSLITLNQLNRAGFELQEGANKQTLTVQINQPLQEAEKFDRSANFTNPFNQSAYLMAASLTARRPDRSQITYFLKDEVVGNIRSQAYTEEVQLIGKIDGAKVMMVRKQNNLLGKFFINDHLCAILAHQKGKFNQDAQYKLYLEPNINSNHKVLIVNLLMAEVLTQALQKFYEIETQGLNKKSKRESDF